jgi:hypothetical protein
VISFTLLVLYLQDINPWFPFDMVGETKSRSEHEAEEKISCPYGESNPGWPAPVSLLIAASVLVDVVVKAGVFTAPLIVATN